MRLRLLYLKLLERIASDAPTLFVIEDAHWIDPASGALLARLVESGLPLLLTARPGHDPDWIARDNVTVLDLAPLDDPDIARIAQATIAMPISDRVARFVTTKAEGNPLIAQEIARALSQDGHLAIIDTGADMQHDPGPLVTGQLEQMVLSRIDRLGATQQETMRFASTIGRVFAASTLEAALQRPADLAGIAQTPGLIEQVAPGRWRFVHALIRDAVYGSLLSAHRREVHHKIARALDAAQGNDSDLAAAVAHHYLHSDAPELAAPHLVRAAGHSLGAYALAETDALSTRAHDLEVRNPGLLDDRSYADMAVYWLRAMDNMGDFRRGMALSRQLLPRLEAMGYSTSLGISRMLTTIALTHAWDYDAAHRMAQTTLDQAERQGDDWGAAWAKVALMRIFDESKRADIATIERLSAEIAPVALQTDDRHMAMTAHYLLSSAYRSTGQRRKALAQVKTIETFSVTQNDRRAMGYAKWARALVHAVEGDPQRAHDAIRDARDYVIPGSGDERVSLGIVYFCASFLGAPGDAPAGIAALEHEAARMADRNIEGSMAYTSAFADLRAGALARGWRKLNALERYIGPKGNVNLMHQVLATRCEILLALAGLIDPASERPQGAPGRPATRPGLADMLLYAQLRPRALRLAERTIAASHALPNGLESAHSTRHTIALGLIHLARGHRQQGRALLQDGLALAESEGVDILARRARTALEAG